jgi:predicted Zn finger-like uncharacterized protein
MIVTCPACATRYLIDPRAVGVAGRSVRCTQCDHVWTQLPPEDAPRRVDLPPPGTAGPPAARLAPPPRGLPPAPAIREETAVNAVVAAGDVVRGGNRPLVIVLLAALVLGALWYGRDFIVERVPALESVYAAFGVAAADLRGDKEIESGLASSHRPGEAKRIG